MKISRSSKVLNDFALLPENVIWFDYRGVGVCEKADELKVSDLKGDALRIFDFANKTFPASTPTVVHGMSTGSIFAMYVATERDPDALTLKGASALFQT